MKTAQVESAPIQFAPGAAPPAPGVKKLSFGKIAAREDKTKTSYPVLPDNPQAIALAESIINKSKELDALNGSLECDKGELRLIVLPPYFQINAGKPVIPSSVIVNSPAGEVLVEFQNAFVGLKDDAPLLPILGERTGLYFRQAFELKIKGDLLPADRAQELLDAVEALFARYNALDALERKESINPTKDFHVQRHSVLTVAENLQLHQVCPMKIAIKTKGRENK